MKYLLIVAVLLTSCTAYADDHRNDNKEHIENNRGHEKYDPYRHYNDICDPLTDCRYNRPPLWYRPYHRPDYYGAYPPYIPIVPYEPYPPYWEYQYEN